MKKKNKLNTFGEYTLENVYKNMPEKTREEIISFWLTNKILKEHVAKKRVHEVAFVIRKKDSEEIAGINTVYIQESQELEGTYYFYRIFIHPKHRGSFKMIEFVSDQTFKFLKSCNGDDPKPEGMAMVMENPKFFDKGARRWLTRLGLIYRGDDFLGREIWFIPFKK